LRICALAAVIMARVSAVIERVFIYCPLAAQ
jgi:hypothetical protein